MHSRPASNLTSLAKDGLDYLILFLPPPFLSAAITGVCHRVCFMEYKRSSIALYTCQAHTMQLSYIFLPLSPSTETLKMNLEAMGLLFFSSSQCGHIEQIWFSLWVVSLLVCWGRKVTKPGFWGMHEIWLWPKSSSNIGDNNKPLCAPWGKVTGSTQQTY